jgi:hypothetical protein
MNEATLDDSVQADSPSVREPTTLSDTPSDTPLEVHQQLIEDTRLQFVHIRPDFEMMNRRYTPYGGGLTICFPLPSKKDNLVTVSLAWCHRNDKFICKEGNRLAALYWFAGNRVQIRLINKGNYSSQLTDIFQTIVNYGLLAYKKPKKVKRIAKEAEPTALKPKPALFGGSCHLQPIFIENPKIV